MSTELKEVRVIYANNWAKSSPGMRNRKYKGPEVRMCPPCLKKVQGGQCGWSRVSDQGEWWEVRLERVPWLRLTKGLWRGHNPRHPPRHR